MCGFESTFQMFGVLGSLLSEQKDVLAHLYPNMVTKAWKTCQIFHQERPASIYHAVMCLEESTSIYKLPFNHEADLKNPLFWEKHF